jgi:Tol biopolymer transport system component
MPTAPIQRMLAALPLVSLLACGQDSAGPSRVVPTQAQYSFAQSEWSAPVNIGAPINSTAGEMNAALSPDELSLYFTSDRAGGLGITDIWVSHRDCGDCPWQTPVNLGAPFNSSSQDAGPRLSIDGHLLFFQSDRPVGSNVGGDIYVSRRNNPNDDFGWGPPVRLGSDVNTPDGTENAAAYLQSAEDGGGNLYFNRTTATVPQPELYVASITRDGETRGPAVPVSELNVIAANDQHATLRKDGREIFFSSNRTGGLGSFDIWTSTRRSVHEPWSPPVAVGAALNTTSSDQQPSLSSDGRTIVFTSNRPGSLGANDLWISTRTASGR